ncbi:MAG: 50S ribosomal protein L11 [Acidimicrobiia bacterium]|nr:50S ribosomal protein L11 [Acidimicrobiia bacterium]
MAKKITTVVKLQIQAGGATPAPPVGTALGPTGVNIMDFCKAYNEATQDKKGQVIPVDISIYDDRTFDFKLKTPPAPKLILKAAGLEKGTDNPRTTKVGKITRAQVKEIAEVKMPDLNAIDIEGAMLQIEGTCRSMGIEVVEA